MEAQPAINQSYVYILIGFAVFIALLCAYVYFYYSKKPEEKAAAEKTDEPKEDPTNALSKAVRFDVPDTQPEIENEPENSTQSWCFVGEDLSGRYCVKVPSDASCTSDRLFKSREECEMVKGSHMPAGITRDGHDFRSIQSMKFSDSMRNKKA
jgi:hypothetical protein